MRPSNRDAADLSRRQAAITRFVSHLHEMGRERELIEALIQAAAVWYDLDARAYRRSAGSRYVLDTRLPGSDPAAYPPEIDCAHLPPLSGPLRILSMSELEQLGWRSIQGEVLLLPVARRGSADWLVVIAGFIGADAEASLSVACRTAGAVLEQIASREARDAQERLARRISGARLSVPGLAQELLGELIGAVHAVRGRLVVRTSATAQPVTLAMIGNAMSTGSGGPESGAVEAAPDRVALSVPLSGGGAAMVELWAAEQEPFTHEHARAAEAGVALIGAWLSGVAAGPWGGLEAREEREATGSPASGRAAGAIEGELDRLQRMSLRGGVLVATLPGRPGGDPRAVTTLIDAMREELRSSDVLGQLASGEIAALLVRAHADGVVSAAWRVRNRLEALARVRRLPSVRLGHALYSTAGAESLSALVARARAATPREPIDQGAM